MRYLKIFFIFLLSYIISTGSTNAATTLLSGIIQFPFSISQIPDIDLFCEGRKITTQISNDDKKIHYSLSHSNYQRNCSLVITQSLELIGKDEIFPTYDYQKIDITKPYKFYTFTFVLEEPQELDDEENDKTQISYRWIVQEQSLEHSQGRVPDNTIIVRYDPTLIESVAGGSALELPTIKIRSDILSYLGSEEIFNDISTRLSCASPDYRLLYTASDQQIKRSSKKVVIITT